MKSLTDPQLAARVALDIPDGSYVNLGIGKPTHVSAYVLEGREVIYHSENGILGVGPTPEPGSEDIEMIDASKRLITTAPGASFFEQSEKFYIAPTTSARFSSIFQEFQTSECVSIADYLVKPALQFIIGNCGIQPLKCVVL